MKQRKKLVGPWPNSVTKKDLEITWFNGSGGGGQNRNKNANCCRMKHIPTGITTQAQEHKSREQNQKAAWQRMTALLVPLIKSLHRATIKTERPTKVVRTYKQKQNLVVDKRLKQKFNMNEILDGQLQEIHN